MSSLRVQVDNLEETSPPSPPRYGTTSTVAGENELHAGQKRPSSALTLGPRKRPNLQTDPLIHHGRHFGRTIYAFANIHALLVAGLGADEEGQPETQQERRELRVYGKLLRLIPGFEERLLSSSSEEEVMAIATMLQKGAACARSDDTKSLKGAVLDWLTPDNEPLRPSLSRNMKINRGFNHERTGFLLCPAELDWSNSEIKKQLRNKELIVLGSHWPMFVYQNERYDPDNPWQGLLKSQLLVAGFKHVFTSPSSVEDEPRATRSGNARIHGMTQVTPASVAYIATQVRFSLSSASIFSRTDKETDSETFYTSILELLEDPEEQDEVKLLMSWWNQQVFPSFSNSRRLAPDNSALSKIKQRRQAMSAIVNTGVVPGSVRPPDVVYGPVRPPGVVHGPARPPRRA